jgi:hypothetical protein
VGGQPKTTIVVSIVYDVPRAQGWESGALAMSVLQYRYWYLTKEYASDFDVNNKIRKREEEIFEQSSVVQKERNLR